jgi:hypothetical protein
LLEERELVAARRSHARRRGDERSFANHRAVDHDALAQRRQMRRGVARDARAWGGRGQRRDHRDGRPLAVGAADMDDVTERAIGRTESIEQLAHALEPELYAKPTRRDESPKHVGIRHG